MVLEIKIPRTEYQPGDTMQGQIAYIKSSGVSHATGIWFEFCGYEEVIDDKDPSLREVNVFYQKRVQVQGVANTANSLSSTFALSPGSYHWPFSVQLPANLPASFRHPSGRCKIAYNLKAEIIVPGGGLKVANTPITIAFNRTSTITLKLPAFDPPSAKNSVSFLLSKGPIVVECMADRAIYRQGEEAGINVTIKNNTNKLIEGVKISIVQSYKYGVKEKTEKVLVKDFLFRKIQVEPHASFNGKLMAKIPEFLWPSILHHKLWSLHYFIVVECVINSKELICPVGLPIIIIASNARSVPTNSGPPPPPPAQTRSQPPPPPPQQMMSMSPPNSPPPQHAYPAYPTQQQQPYPTQQGQIVMTAQGPMMLMPLAQNDFGYQQQNPQAYLQQPPPPNALPPTPLYPLSSQNPQPPAYPPPQDSLYADFQNKTRSNSGNLPVPTTNENRSASPSQMRPSMVLYPNLNPEQQQQQQRQQLQQKQEPNTPPRYTLVANLPPPPPPSSSSSSQPGNTLAVSQPPSDYMPYQPLDFLHQTEKNFPLTSSLEMRIEEASAPPQTQSQYSSHH